jgi:hypothetical protein
MDTEFEKQIDEMIQKAHTDLKSKICKLIVKQQNKLIKDHTRKLKETGLLTVRRQQSRKEDTKQRDTRQRDSDSESD